jgi:hypothetical protein
LAIFLTESLSTKYIFKTEFSNEELAATPPGATSNAMDGPEGPELATNLELSDDTINKHLNLFFEIFPKNRRKALSKRKLFSKDRVFRCHPKRP